MNDFALFSILKTTRSHSPSPDDVCLHSSIIHESGNLLCKSCGIEVAERDGQTSNQNTDSKFNSDSTRCYIRKSTERSIHQDVQHIPISDHIKDIANDIYNEICREKIHRGVFRKSIVFASVFYAYKFDKSPQSCDHLIKVFNIKRKSALKGLKYVHEHLPPRSPLRTLYITAEDLIQEFMIKFDTSSVQISEVIELYNLIKGRSDSLNRSRPQSVAAGIIYYYTLSQGRNMSIKNFIKKVHLSELTVMKGAKECSRILNTPNILNWN
jgi:transcription initiation factor TFIIIB Brf1 subunit/transcription initiation factor TFIIB